MTLQTPTTDMPKLARRRARAAHDARPKTPGFACVIEDDTSLDGIVTSPEGRPLFRASTLAEAIEIWQTYGKNRKAREYQITLGAQKPEAGWPVTAPLPEQAILWAEGTNGYAEVARFTKFGYYRPSCPDKAVFFPKA